MDWGIRFLDDPDLPGTGEISGAFWRENKEILAVVSNFDLLATPPARAAYGGQRLRHRVALYRPPHTRPFAVYDSASLPINDVAFHPSQSVVAIGGGSYDGKYAFQGELILWDWEKNRSIETRSMPQVLRLRFSEEGHLLHAAVRPWDDHLRAGQANPFRTFYPLTLPYGRTVSLDGIDAGEIGSQIEHEKPRTEGSDGNEFLSSAQDPRKAVADAFGLATLKQRSPIWDIAAIAGDMIAVVHDGCLLEIYDGRGELIRSFKGEGCGVQIFAAADLVLHVSHHDKTSRSWETAYRSELMALQKGELKSIASLEYPYTFSRSRDGLLLGRHFRVSLRVANDLIVDPATGRSLRLDLGHYDVFNHYARIDGAPYLFFLQGTPPYSPQRKQLCSVAPNGEVRRIWPLLDDLGDHASHAMECCFEFVQDDLGEGVIVAGKHYNPAPQAYEGFIYRKSLKTGKELWRHKTTASASCIKHIGSKSVVVAAFLDGGLGLFRATRGDVLRWDRFAPDGHDSVVFSLAADHAHLVIGAIDGRFGIASIDDFVGTAGA